MSKYVAIYTRVSTNHQDLQLQVTELDRFVRAREWTVFDTYSDIASGTSNRRSGLKALMEQARARRIDIVCCWKLDRFFRSLKDMVNTLQEFEALGIQFISIQDQIDLTTPSGRLMTHLIAAFAEFEASIIRERVRAGIANAIAKGKRLGRPIEIREELVRTYRKQGMSYRAIAKKLGYSSSGVHNVIRKQSLKSANTTKVEKGKYADQKTND